MPTPLPAITVPDNMPTLNAYRVGQQDRIAQDERNVLKEAGGLAAAGNYKGAQSALYKGGNFGEARSVAGELRAQSAEGRAQASHLRSMQNDKLERTAKTYEMFGRLIPTIDSPEKLEMAKSLIKQRTGLDLSQVTMEQLPMLYKQGISQQQQLENEMAERKALADKARADQAQSNQDRTYDLNVRRTDIMGQKAGKTAAPKPLTEGQSKARGFLGTMEQAEAVMGQFMKENNAPPLSARALGIYLNSPSWATSTLLNKQERQYIQAMEQWVRAKLRKESGATIGADEIRGEMGVYVPTSDEDSKTRLQKNLARQKAQEGLRIEGAYNAPGAPDATPQDDWSDITILSEE